MGNPNVGKTSIINSFITRKSQKGEQKVRNLLTANDYIQVMQIKDRSGETHELTLHIWDAAGDATVHHVAHLFLENTKVAVLCYAIDDQRSYEQLDAWIDHIKDKEGMFSVILGNKEDLSAHRSVP